MRSHYTVAEANRALPYVRSIVGEIQERYRELCERGEEHNALPKEEGSRRADLKGAIRTQAERIHACLGELEEIGIELKDYERGLVDFPARLEGRPILLCWEAEEEEVAFWHEPEGGFAGRRPVPVEEPDWPAVTARA